MSACPICGKEVDSLRAPAVGVREGKVIAYCSKEHAAMAESGPAKLVPTKIVRLPSEPKPVPVLTPASGIPTGTTPSIDSGPVIEVVESTKPRKKRMDSSVQIADTGTIDDYVTHEPNRGRWIAVAIFIVAGGVAVAYFTGALDTLLGRRKAAAPVVTPTPPPLPATPPDAAPPLGKQGAIERATTTLRGLLTSGSPRVQRLAAAALSRTGDKDAIELLVRELASEPSDVAKTELAYFIGRAGDKRGAEALVAATPTKREMKHEAGRRLAMLGDPRAVKILESSLAYPQFKLGVAEALAFVREPRALAILSATLADPNALPDDKARAAIALGWAGQASAAPALRELIANDRGKALAAHALANLHDEAARPELEAQLDVPSLRVRAARALRLLSPARDTTPYLEKLVESLSSQKDTDQIDAAEALLLLAGPAEWATNE